MTMRVLTASQMQEVDAETIARVCPGLELMERAGRGVAKAVLARYRTPNGGDHKAAIFVGSGNNGGDGLVAARLLVEAGWRCSIHLLKPAGELTPDSAKNYQRLHAVKARAGSLTEFDSTRPDWPERAREDLADVTLLVDSIFGTGSTGAPRGRAAEMIALMNTRRLPIVAIDIPSGVDATTGDVPGEAVRATQTITIGVPKTGLLFHPGKAHTGELSVIDIGFPEEIIVAHADDVHYNDEAEAARRLPARAPDLHKYDAGVLLVIAGSERYRGAALLAGEAALRAGCGMVYLAVPEGIHREMSVALREAITVPLPRTADGTIALTATHALGSYVEKADAIAVGPGLGRHDETDAFVRELVRACGKPIVVDADGITAFAARADELKQAGGSIVITPHSGELARLTGETVPTTGPARVTFTAEVARRLGVTLVHKGAPALIASPGGRVWINASGSSALATGGTGDVLTGLVGSLLAQASARGSGRGPGERAQPMDAACVGCFLQGRAGEIAARTRSVRGVIAGDLLESLGPALVALETVAGA
jgi:NAD(P)H-hydrate epimerase